MSDTLELYAIDWGNGFVGFFKKSTLDQFANVYADAKGWSGLDMMHELRRFATMGGRSGKITIEFLDGGHEALNKLRRERGIETKPMLF